MADHPHTPAQRPKPVAVLDVAEVTRAVENYIAAKRPDLLQHIQAHGIRMTENGQFLWELHGERLNGIEVVEVTLQKAG